MKIQTFIFFDLETTGLIKERTMPKIAEIALIAVARDSILYNDKKSLPRIMHKLVLPVKPQKIIPPEVEILTKLSNEDMQLLQPFEIGVYDLIMHFLQRLTPPICFAAHNGYRFDYPIFLWELQCINKIFDNSILCVDTWKMFQDFFKERDAEQKLFYDLLNDEYNNALSRLNMTMNEEAKVITASTSQAMLPCDQEHTMVVNKKKHNMSEEYSDLVDFQSPKHSRQENNERTPESQIIRQQNVFAGRRLRNEVPRKRLDFGSKQKMSLNLGAIYKHMFGSNAAQEHSAEGDCLTMIRCVTNIGDFFLEWSDDNASSLDSYKKT